MRRPLDRRGGRASRRATGAGADQAPRLLALDFDGVLCDGRREYLESGWRAYLQAWPGPRPGERPERLAEEFVRRRPLVESGWEFPVLIHALRSGAPEEALGDRRAWGATALRLVAEAGVAPAALGRALNRVRDEWFARDPDGWLGLHRFYPGVVERVEAALDGGVGVAIVTTKAERFVRALLASRSARLAAVAIIGREPARAVPKVESLRRLIAAHGLPADGAGLWFVEDLLETLEAMRAEPALDGVRLFLAAWGYTTLEQRAAVGLRAGIALLSPGRFAAPFATWP